MRFWMVLWIPMALAGLVLSSCTSYTPKPLDPLEIVSMVDDLRRAPEGAPQKEDVPVFTLSLAAQWMREHGPSVKEAVAAYQTAIARAQIATPFPNPGLEIGPQWGFGADVESVNQVTPFGSIGISIPLGGRLARQDDLNGALADVARIDGLARHRELYLQLRELYTELVTARARERLQDHISEATLRTAQVARQLVEAGSATAVDLALFELEHARSLSAPLAAAQVTAKTEAALSDLIGVHAGLFGKLQESPLPILPSMDVDLEALRDILVSHHPVLGRLRATYEAAECSLRLQIARQYPDLRIGPSYAGDPGERKTVLGLTLGIELPLFDRNQQAIAEAIGRRDQVRVRYEAAANRALAELEGAVRFLMLTRRRRELLQEQIVPRAETSVRIARESLAAGSGDALRLLDAQRSQRETQVELLDAELDERESWAALEQAVGYPLMIFPSETPDTAVHPPEGLRARDDGNAPPEKESR